MKKLQYILIILIICLTLITRLYRFDQPIADWHSWRQVDTSAVSRNFVKNGFDILHPRFDDLSNLPSGKDNPNGYRFVEFPIYNILQAGFFKSFGIFTLEEWGRLVSIGSSMLSVLFIYLIVKRHADGIAAFSAAFFYAVLPFNIYYGRVILPDPTMVMASLGGIYFFDKWLEKNKWRWFIVSMFFTTAALLLKPYAIFFVLPIIYLSFVKFGKKILLKWQLYLYALATVTPLILWRIWMTQFPEGIPANEWLFNGGDIRFKGAFFYWLFADRIGRLILGFWGLVIFGFGLLSLGKKKTEKENKFFFSFLLSSLLYLTVIARGNVQHDYYQILIMPSIAILLGLGASLLTKLAENYFHKSTGITMLVISTIFCLMFSWYFIRDYFNINNPSIITAGKEIDKILPKDAKIIAILHGGEGDTAFLYQTNRKGWTLFELDLDKMTKLGAQYLVFANPQESDKEYAKKYKLISSTSDYILFDLQNK